MTSARILISLLLGASALALAVLGAFTWNAHPPLSDLSLTLISAGPTGSGVEVFEHLRRVPSGKLPFHRVGIGRGRLWFQRVYEQEQGVRGPHHSEIPPMVRKWGPFRLSQLRVKTESELLIGTDTDYATRDSGHLKVPWKYQYHMVLSTPLWMPVGLLLIYPAAAGSRSVVRRHWRRRAGNCERCGYDLRGNVSNRCPECGGPTPARSVSLIDCASRVSRLPARLPGALSLHESGEPTQ